MHTTPTSTRHPPVFRSIPSLKAKAAPFSRFVEPCGARKKKGRRIDMPHLSIVAVAKLCLAAHGCARRLRAHCSVLPPMRLNIGCRLRGVDTQQRLGWSRPPPFHGHDVQGHCCVLLLRVAGTVPARRPTVCVLPCAAAPTRSLGHAWFPECNSVRRATGRQLRRQKRIATHGMSGGE